jgi:predicted RNase H-like nuclease
VVGLFRSRVALQAEILVLRHQLNVLRRKSPRRVALGNIDRVVLIGLYRLAPGRSRRTCDLTSSIGVRLNAQSRSNGWLYDA